MNFKTKKKNKKVAKATLFHLQKDNFQKFNGFQLVCLFQFLERGDIYPAKQARANHR